MNLRLSIGGTVGICSALLGLLPLAACSGREIPLGTGVQSSGDSVPVQGVGGCSPAQCANMAAGCVPGRPANVQCAPDPLRGQGSVAADACTLTFSCIDGSIEGKGGCSPEQCSQEAIQCASGVASNVQCVPDPNRGLGSVAADACTLTADCADPVACDPVLCTGQQIPCDGGKAQCVETPIVSVGNMAGGGCQLVCVYGDGNDGGPQRAGASVDAAIGPVGDAGSPAPSCDP
jgi:hypothetical protein